MNLCFLLCVPCYIRCQLFEIVIDQIKVISTTYKASFFSKAIFMKKLGDKIESLCFY